MILAPPAQLAPVQFSPEAEQMKLVALESCALIGAVRNADENGIAAGAQRQIKEVLSAVERARKAAKAPILDAGKRLDSACDGWVKELKQEEIRIATEIGNFQQAELEKQRAEARRIAAEQDRIERERLAELHRIEEEQRKAAVEARMKAEAEAKAARNATEAAAAVERAKQAEAEAARKADEARKFAEAEAAQRAESIKPPAVAPVRAEGQVVRTEWEIVRINDWVLSKARPDLVRKIEFDLVGVKAALARGEKLPGVEAREVIKSSVRTGGRVIDV
jgi:hypothetical protein